MDLSKIFLKEACPTSVGGQAVMEGIMMRGQERTAIAVRMPDGVIHLKTEKLKPKGKVWKIPLLRGVVSFGSSLVTGTKTLMYSAEALENYENEHAEELAKIREEQRAAGTEDGSIKGPEYYEKDKFTLWTEKHFGEKAAWNMMIYASVVLALLFTVGIFIVVPTIAVNWCGRLIQNEILLNLIEGILRIVLFVGYIMLISKMEDIKRVFQFHGAEHKCIHCFENGLELTPANCKPFYTLHPRCGTSFLMFIMVISLILFSLLGWPNLLLRVTSRILLIPVIAGLSYELLKWAGRSDNIVVRILSLPGLYLQKLTTKEPDEKQLEVAIVAMKAVMVPAETEELDLYMPSYEAYTQEVLLGK
ncbi:DUF1385 domain-containing protein [Aminipila luticellarii]|uniref:DUF1385 domain-containing protein n=1 Tax=Aminipila luticellarii TaxID=2507160 RepID=A0A410PSS5_9FIRM|nr:DUF1385 domain-containing protein [Aminipila luticellarii]QAT41936.1 DUF1385 domain-containing protein [Aminipila luticellarii]